MTDQPPEVANANAAAAQADTAPLKGYVPFPSELRTKPHIEPRFAAEAPKKTAVLVLHGIGAQKPYETLDQFARGLLGFFKSPQPAQGPANQATREIRLRQYKANLNTNEKDWTQAFVRVRTASRPGDVIDLYEYYWAPVITDRVSALQSLKFLIAAGLSPFQYLRDNLTVINKAHSNASTGNKFSWLLFAFCREIYRMLIWTLFAVLLVVPRLLDGRLDLSALTKDFLQLPFWIQMAYGASFVLVLLGVSFCSKIFRSAWKRAGSALTRHLALAIVALAAAALIATAFSVPRLKLSLAKAVDLLSLPTFLNWRHVIFYVFLAIFAYVGQAVLTSAIGCLAVYLGADDLSKNFAARSQILHECTTLLIYLLAGRDEAGAPSKEWTYDEVLLAGHSLGSVIAYDSLSQLIIRDLAKDPTLSDVPLEKIKGLLTFGCPLNKVVYFFRARTNRRTNVLSQILYTLHSFRLRTPLPSEANPEISVPHPFPENLPFAPDFLWYNAYSPFDIISGRMQFYTADWDVPVERGVMPWTAHLSYWENDDLYSLFSDLLYSRPSANQAGAG